MDNIIDEATLERLKAENEPKVTVELPMIALRGMVVYPHGYMNFDIGREPSVAAVTKSKEQDSYIFLVAQKDVRIFDPEEDDIYAIGTICKIKQTVEMPGKVIRVLVDGVSRAKIVSYKQKKPYFSVEVEPLEDISEDAILEESIFRLTVELMGDYVKMSDKLQPEVVLALNNTDAAGEFCDMVATNIFMRIDDKQAILEELYVNKRLEKTYSILMREMDLIKTEKRITTRVKRQIDKSQREYYLREQQKAIQKELGEGDELYEESKEYRKKLKNAKLPKETLEKALKEVDRLSKMGPGSAEGAVVRSYLDWILDLPWDTYTQDNLDIKNAQEILDEDHYGLEKVKERLLEFLAVKKITNSMKGSIICLVGPPGVGKTSIGRSIARALNRSFVRMSLGGMRDEAEIRGHRRTYVGSIPGRIIAGMKQAKSMNPVFLLDEIDKLNGDFRGDPASALLEVLDAEQNNAYRDHYLEVPFDLSNVLFITTANTIQTIPHALLDRLEVINVSGYTDDEKIEIATKYLVPKMKENHGLKPGQLTITRQALADVIHMYTRESGVRELEREVAALCRKAARKIAEDPTLKIKIGVKDVPEYLGVSKYSCDKLNKNDEVGLVTGLAWTSVGGDTLTIEAAVIPGKGNIVLTGHLGDVMKESAAAGITYIRSRAAKYNIEPKVFAENDIHIHVPEGAVPKDGPSAGITMATAVLSALTGIPVKKDVAMTGEITLRGRVLEIGGLKEKSLAAYRLGIKTVVIPKGNEKDINEIPENVKSKITFIQVENMDEVLEVALSKKKGNK
ncbi:MAG: endopeptidase La [Clostridiales bacterium]|nr:endopeptidase La [Clostridiales bacterium]